MLQVKYEICVANLKTLSKITTQIPSKHLQRKLRLLEKLTTQ